MTHTSYLDYKRTFVDAARKVLAGGGSEVLNEAAFPAYANPHPMISFLFWRRIFKVMRFLERRGPCQKILDFGTGSGVMLPFLGRMAQQVLAVDVDLSPFQKISDYLHFPQNVTAENIRQKPLASWSANTFDVILALDVLEHVSGLDDTVAELGRLLAPTGILVVSGPTESAFYKLGRRLAGREYSGDYHVRNIYDIRSALAKVVEVNTLATLYYPIPLFKLYLGRKRVGTI